MPAPGVWLGHMLSPHLEWLCCGRLSKAAASKGLKRNSDGYGACAILAFLPSRRKRNLSKCSREQSLKQ
jgi:hypothetical protein